MKAIARDGWFGHRPASVYNDLAEEDPVDDSRCEPICASVGPDDCGFSFPETAASSLADEYRPLRVTDVAIAGSLVGLAYASTAC